MNQISSCVFDLETSNLSADYGIVLCAAIMPGGNGVKPKVFRGDSSPRWITHRSDDSWLVRQIVAELSKYDIWIAHNGQKFDVPFLRTRLLHHAMPPLPGKKLVDPVLLARNKLRVSYNSLKQLAALLGVNTKTEIEPHHWLRAALDGSTRSMSYIVEHCIQDVIVLDKIVAKLKDYSTTLNTYGSGF